MRRFLNKGLSAALNQWAAVWRERQRIKTLARRMGADGGVGKAWRQWRGEAETHAWLKGQAARLAKSGLLRAYNRWLEALEERASMRRFLKRSLNGGLARGFSAWADAAEQGKRERRMLGKFGARLLKAKEVQCFNQWAAVLAEAQRLRAFGRRMLSVGVTKALNAWVDFVEERARLQRLMARAASGPLARAFGAWLDALDEIARVRGVVARVSTRAQGCLARLQPVGRGGRRGRAAPRLWRADGQRADAQGVEPVGVALAEWRRLKGYGSRIAMAGVTKALNAWVEFVEERARLKAFGHRLLHRGLVKALNAWVEQAAQVGKMAGAMHRALNARLSAAWNAWVASTDEHYRLADFANRMLQRELLKGWNKWYAQLEEYWRLQKDLCAHAPRGRGARLRPLDRDARERQRDTAARARPHAHPAPEETRARVAHVAQHRQRADRARGRIRDTFKFSKAPPEEDLHAEAVDWRASLNRGRTKGGHRAVMIVTARMAERTPHGRIRACSMCLRHPKVAVRVQGMDGHARLIATIGVRGGGSSLRLDRWRETRDTRTGVLCDQPAGT